MEKRGVVPVPVLKRKCLKRERREKETLVASTFVSDNNRICKLLLNYFAPPPYGNARLPTVILNYKEFSFDEVVSCGECVILFYTALKVLGTKNQKVLLELMIASS